MILPIVTYGDAILREPTQSVTGDSSELQKFIDDLIETMHQADGIGLAAPQVGDSRRLFVVDLSAFLRDLDPKDLDGEIDPRFEAPMVFINPQTVEFFDDDVSYEEGCLSLPDLREEVIRPETVQLKFLDRAFVPQEIVVSGMPARVIQHEYDHLEGILFVDRVSAFRKRMLKRKLRDMAHGHVEAPYLLRVSGQVRQPV